MIVVIVVLQLPSFVFWQLPRTVPTPQHRLIRENTMNGSLGLMKWNKVHFRVGRFVNANEPLVISCFCYGQPPHSDGMGVWGGRWVSYFGANGFTGVGVGIRGSDPNHCHLDLQSIKRLEGSMMPIELDVCWLSHILRLCVGKNTTLMQWRLSSRGPTDTCPLDCD